MINCIIIDDEQHAIDVTRSFCHKIPYLNVIGEFTDPLEAVSFIDMHLDKIDLVFVDVEMPRFSGIDFLKAYTFPHVILVTGHRGYAVTAFEHDATDFLLKPVSFERFSSVIKKVHEAQLQKNSISQRHKDEENDMIIIKTSRNKYVKVNHAIIRYIEGAKNYSLIYTVEGETLTSLKLKDLEVMLPQNRFIRIHKSHIIHLEYFESIDGNRIQMNGVDKVLSVGDAYRKEFITFLQKQVR